MKTNPPVRKTDTSHITICDAVAARLVSDYNLLGTWRAVAAKYGVSAGMAQRVATTEYRPKNVEIRRRLGLPVTVPAPVCPACGVVHVKKCPAKASPPAWVTAAADFLRCRERATEPRVWGRGGKGVTHG